MKLKILCNFCNNSFSTRCGLLRHQKNTLYCLEIQYKKMKYKCEFCGSFLTGKAGLKKHQENTKYCLKIQKLDSHSDLELESDTEDESEDETKKVKIPKRIRDLVWKQYSNKTVDKCYVCSEMISFDNFECGHIIARSRGGSNKLENLKPVCGPCNKGIGSKNMNNYKL